MDDNTRVNIPVHRPDLSLSTKSRMFAARRFRALQTNQGLISSFAAVCGFFALLIYLETSRMLIPSTMVTKKDLRSLTSGFSRDPHSGNEADHKDVPLHLSPQKRRPSAIIVGFSQCGGHMITTALSAHPDILVNRKEVKYFSGPAGTRSLQWYISQMPLSLEHHRTIDVNYYYISSKQALERIKAFNKTMRIIVVVCDPISRLITRFNEERKRELAESQNKTTLPPAPPPFDAAAFRKWLSIKTNGTRVLDKDFLLRMGEYLNKIVDLFLVFPRKHVYFIDKTQFYKNPREEIGKIHKFLKVHQDIETQPKEESAASDGQMCFTITEDWRKCLKDQSKASLEVMTKKDKPLLEWLRKFYQPHNIQFFLYIDQNFNWT